MSSDAVDRTPFEVWRNVFEFFLGISLLDPEEPTMRGYRRLLADEASLPLSFRAQEQCRGILRLVCRSWKELADMLGDKIVVSLLGEADWPPHGSREGAKYISYRNLTPIQWVDPIHDYKRLFRNRRLAATSLVPIQVNRSLIFAPITSLIANSLDVSSIQDITETANVYFLRILEAPADLRFMMYPLFANVRILYLSHYFPQRYLAKEVMLPNLRCLILGTIMANNEREPHVKSLSSCYFPKLIMFGLLSSRHWNSVSTDIFDFLSNGAKTFEEIELPFRLATMAAQGVDWSPFVRLRSLTLPSLSYLADALPSLAQRWESKRPNDGKDTFDIPRVAITLSLNATSDTAELVARIEPYRWVISHIYTLESWNYTSERLLRGIRDADNRDASDPLQNLRRRLRSNANTFFDVIDKVPLVVFDSDGKPASCNEAKELRVLTSDISW
ncbi:hypothetical protein PIIN_06591 [Serendipita indica DSM 11827]|uniref:F-box domain-containing protein n=1 Tax=Serendipita indica (strain DSM 11827) TaxID=1109443 RepID=G4TMW1_SERID|nr:hypothetical protein PIIN_06591 [Serendipita indica DSM 11827]